MQIYVQVVNSNDEVRSKWGYESDVIPRKGEFLTYIMNSLEDEQVFIVMEVSHRLMGKQKQIDKFPLRQEVIDIKVSEIMKGSNEYLHKTNR